MKCCLAYFTVLVVACTANAEDRLKAGAAVADITPPMGQMIVGSWKPMPAKTVHDRLHARCLVLEYGTKRMAFVVSDNVGIPAEVFDAARSQIPGSCGLQVEHILMSSTHTHSATTARAETRLAPSKTLNAYQKQLARGIADSVVKAVSKLQPAELAVGSVDAPKEVFCRRWHMAPGFPMPNPFGGVDKVRMNPPRGNGALLRPAGPIDPEVAFIAVRTTNGKPIALFANYSLHYVGGVPNGEISADYFAIFANRMKELLKADDDFVGIMSNGTSGNINNIDFQNKNRKKRAHYEKMTEVAHYVADKVFAATDGLKYKSSFYNFGHNIDHVTLKVRKPTREMLEWFKKVDSRPTDEKLRQPREKIYSARIQNLGNEPAQIEVALQTFAIDDLAIATIPFEVFSEIGLEIKEKSPFKNTFTVSLANGSFGYLPTPEQHKLGGYETWLGTNYVEFNSSRVMTDKLLKALKENHVGELVGTP